MRFTRCIPADAPIPDILKFALTCDAYGRISAEVEQLHGLVEPVLTSLSTERVVAEWAGIDLLRGTLFFVQGQTHHWGDVPNEQEDFMRQLVRSIGIIATDADVVADDM